MKAIQTNKNYILLYNKKNILSYIGIIMLIFASLPASAQIKKGNKGFTKTTTKKDSTLNLNNILTPPDSLKNIAINDSTKKDSAVAVVDKKTLVIDSLKKNSDIKEPVIYAADDSVVFDIEKGVLYYYTNVKIAYTDLTIDAARVRIEWDKQTMYAEGIEDTITGTGNGRPVFKQGENTYNAKTMSYNFKSQKGRIVGVRTQENDGYIFADAVKRMPDNSFFGLNGKYTTCDDPEHPHFYIRSRKMKVVPNKFIISGPLNLVIEDFQIPVTIPFSFLPSPKKQKNGIILPRYGRVGDKGFGLTNLGFYYHPNDYVDFLFNGDGYVKGSWRLGLKSNYALKNRFSGSVNFNYGINRFGETKDPDFKKIVGWNLNVSHNQKINPQTSISAQISFDQQFNRNLNYNTNFTGNSNNYFSNVQNSSVSLSKSKIGRLPISMNLGANLSQDVNKKTVSLRAPSLNLNAQQMFPFKNVGATSKAWEWVRQIGVGYSMNFTNSFTTMRDSILPLVIANPSGTYPIYSTSDTVYKKGYDLIQSGLTHTVPVSTRIRLFKYINISPSANYTEYWYTKSVQKAYNTTTNQVETTTINGFKTARDYSTSVSMNTILYGMYSLSKSKKEIKVRQVITPTMSYTYKPDFSKGTGFYDTYIDGNGTRQVYSIFEGNPNGGPSSGEQQTLTFNVQNSFEMKRRKKASFSDDFDEKQDKYERIRLIDRINLGSAYNFAADSLNWSRLSLSGGTNIPLNPSNPQSGQTLNFNFNSSFDPYAVNANGVRINKYQYQVNKQLLRFESLNLSLSTSLQPSSSKGKPIVKKVYQYANPLDSLQAYSIQQFKNQYIDFTVPWQMSLSYNFNYTAPVKSTQKATVTNVLNFYGNTSLTDKWKIGFNSGLTLNQNTTTGKYKLDATSNTSFTVHRDLHCWEFNFSWFPFGPLQSYTFSLDVKSGALKGLIPAKQNRWTDKFR